MPEEQKDCPTISLNNAQKVVALIIGVITILGVLITFATRLNITEAKTNQNSEDVKVLKEQYTVFNGKLDTVIEKLNMVIDGKIIISTK